MAKWMSPLVASKSPHPLKVKVDLAPVSSLKPRVRAEALADAVAV